MAAFAKSTGVGPADLGVAVQRAAALGVVKFACREIGRGFGLLRILNCGLCLLEGVVRPEAAVVQQRVGWTPFVELHHQAKLLARVVADKSRETIDFAFSSECVRSCQPIALLWSAIFVSRCLPNRRSRILYRPPPILIAPRRPWRGRWCDQRAL